jgi:uncharacterized protein with GYD domain
MHGKKRFAEKGEKAMAIYIMLASFTDQGIRKVSDSPKRTDAFREMAKKCGATVRDVFWTLGEYDIVAIVAAHFWQSLKQPSHRVFPVARLRWWCRSPRVARATLPGALLRKA